MNWLTFVAFSHICILSVSIFVNLLSKPELSAAVIVDSIIITTSLDVLWMSPAVIPKGAPHILSKNVDVEGKYLVRGNKCLFASYRVCIWICSVAGQFHGQYALSKFCFEVWQSGSLVIPSLQLHIGLMVRNLFVQLSFLVFCLSSR